MASEIDVLVSSLRSARRETLRNINSLSTSSGVYAIWDDTGCQYVGDADNIANRIKNHLSGDPRSSTFLYNRTRRLNSFEGSRSTLNAHEEFRALAKEDRGSISNFKVSFVEVSSFTLRRAVEAKAIHEFLPINNRR